MSGEALVVGFGETRYARRPPTETTTQSLLAEAARAALGDAGLEPSDVDGLGVSSFSLAPDRAVDLSVRLGLTCSWLMDAGTGGASALDMLQHARRGVESGDAQTIVLVAGDHFERHAFAELVDGYNVATRDHLASIPVGGPNALFALLTTRHMRRYELKREDYGGIVVAQRAWAVGNPNAAFRDPLTLTEYLEAPIVADPLGRYDCPPVVSGAAAVVVSSRDVHGHGVRIKSLVCRHGAAGQDDDGLRTGLADVATNLWEQASVTPGEINVCSVYDDYPVMVLVQLADLGFAPDGDVAAVARRIAERSLCVNTGGGQLSAGQAGAGGGMLGLVEVIRQLRQSTNDSTIDTRLGLVTGYGMVTYRFGASVNAAVLERP